MNLLVSEVREKDYITVFLSERKTGRVIMPQKYGEIHSAAEKYSGLWFRQRLKWESLKWINRQQKLTGQK
ncbi:MAG: hypothetical protein QME85_10360 [Candidatus Saccharicenans sp.]|nr:hypothetical protein [Candidatus Saccharicenans sp.]